MRRMSEFDLYSLTYYWSDWRVQESNTFFTTECLYKALNEYLKTDLHPVHTDTVALVSTPQALFSVKPDDAAVSTPQPSFTVEDDAVPSPKTLGITGMAFVK